MKIIYGLLLLAGASVAASSQTAMTEQTVAVNPPFRLTIDAQPTAPTPGNIAAPVVKAGSPVVLRIRKTNISDHEIVKWSEIDESFGVSFKVRDGNGSPVERRKSNNQSAGELPLSGGEMRLRDTPDMVLQPGESKDDTAPVSDWFDISKPGTYTIQVPAHITNDPASDVVKSNIITVTVLPAENKPSAESKQSKDGEPAAEEPTAPEASAPK